MQILKILLWGAFFAVATLFWIVVFEYGFSNIGSNMKAELSGLHELFGTDFIGNCILRHKMDAILLQ